RKIARLGPLSLQADIRSLSGTPSWVLPFFAGLAALRPDRPMRSTSWYPDLELFVHGGVGFGPYRSQFEAIFAGAHVDMREVYPASEGFLAIADRGPEQGMRLLADNGLFLEFVPVEEIDLPAPTRHWVGDLAIGQNYAVVVSSNAGLFAYVLGDTVRFVDRAPPRLLVTGRLGWSLSAFGEHLIGAEIEAALQRASAAVGIPLREYAVTPLYPFGYGLTYTKFGISNVSLSSSTMSPDGVVEVSADVKNEGAVAGDEVVQLYIHDPVASIEQPVRRLRGFQRVTLEPNETKTVKFRLGPSDVGFYDEGGNLVVEPGEIEVFVGDSSEAPPAGSFEVTG
ncbi:MAG: GH3 auxin-responsive promoter family protein, partial [Rhodospirillales bacterium]|nr:GH3 auxin-responsive promoter family protein [Rhodospirillales bacterium]